MNASKCVLPPPLFAPDQGSVVRAPERAERGYWAGAPAAVYDEESGRYYLSYRRRRPRGVERERGFLTAVAVSQDGKEFQDVWELGKEALGTSSIERCSLLRSPEGLWLYYLSYVDPEDGRWRIDRIEGPSPARLDPLTRREILTARTASKLRGRPVEGVKDPNVYCLGGLYVMLVSFAEPRGAGTEPRRLHGDHDAYNTGLVRAHSAVCVSHDGRNFEWAADALLAGGGDDWDGYQARLTSLLRRPGHWFGFYDGSGSVAENYEEKAGLAVSLDLFHWRRLTVEGPAFTAPGGGSVRYIDALPSGRGILYYYEYSRPDGAHELRVAETEEAPAERPVTPPSARG